MYLPTHRGALCIYLATGGCAVSTWLYTDVLMSVKRTRRRNYWCAGPWSMQCYNILCTDLFFLIGVQFDLR